jgi:hypothetical protein
LFRSNFKQQLIDLKPVFADEQSDSMLVTIIALEYNYTAHNAAIHQDLEAFYKEVAEGTHLLLFICTIFLINLCA